jgi:hypothetical protein
MHAGPHEAPSWRPRRSRDGSLETTPAQYRITGMTCLLACCAPPPPRAGPSPLRHPTDRRRTQTSRGRPGAIARPLPPARGPVEPGPSRPNASTFSTAPGLPLFPPLLAPLPTSAPRCCATRGGSPRLHRVRMKYEALCYTSALSPLMPLIGATLRTAPGPRRCATTLRSPRFRLLSSSYRIASKSRSPVGSAVRTDPSTAQ